jgi:hypothetical protein
MPAGQDELSPEGHQMEEPEQTLAYSKEMPQKYKLRGSDGEKVKGVEVGAAVELSSLAVELSQESPGPKQ